MAKQEKKVEFVWDGVNKRGQKVNGSLSGQNMAMVKVQLRKQGIQPLFTFKAPHKYYPAGHIWLSIHYSVS